jgi:hypothetical protein
MKFHPYSEVFPLIEGADFDSLVADIKEHGLREKIWLYDGKVIDGRNRFLACQKAKVKPQYRELKGKDEGALAFVISANVNRRHLTPQQRAMAAARIATMRQGARTDIAPRDAMSQTDAAEELDVSRRSVQRAKQVIEKGSAALQAAVESGEVPLKKAATVVDLPKKEQLAAAKSKPEKSEPEFQERYEFDEKDDEVIAIAEREYQASIDKVMDSDDRLVKANEEIKRLTGLVAVLTRTRDQYMTSYGEAVKMVKRLQRENDRLKRTDRPRSNGHAAVM